MKKENSGFEEIQYLVFDIESIPDSRLIRMVKFPSEDMTDEEAVGRLQQDIMELTDGKTDFIPVTFQLPISVCVAKVRKDYTLAEVVSLDEPDFRPAEMTRLFWLGVEKLYDHASMVTFNGRGFDIPLLELMAYRYGITVKRHFRDKFAGRYRFGTKHIDLQDWVSNFSAIKVAGGLNLLAKIIGKPGKTTTKGDEVYSLFLEGKYSQINDYCIHDVLDTYFVFLRTRVLLGELDIEREQEIVRGTRNYLQENSTKIGAFASYLDNWGDWDPWPSGSLLV